MLQAPTIGLALNRQRVTAATVQRQGDAYVLTRYAEAEFPGREEEAQMTILSELLQDWEIRKKRNRLYLGVSSPEMVLRLLHMPPMPRSEMQQVLAGELEDYAVFAGEEPIFDFAPVPQLDGQPSGEVLVGAFPQPFSQAYYQRFKQAGLPPAGLDITHLAALRAIVPYDMMQATSLPAMVLLVDAEVSYAVGYRSGELFFLHPMDIGSFRLTEEGGIEDFLHEFQLGWNYYHADFQDAQPFERILVAADAVNAQELCEQLGQTVHVSTVQLADPYLHLSEVACDSHGWQTHLFSTATAIGLAMTGASLAGYRPALNLLPRQAISYARVRPQIVRLGWLVAASLGLVLAGHLYFSSQVRELTDRTARAEEQIEQLERSQLAPLLKLKERVGRLEQRLVLYENFLEAHNGQRRAFLLHWLGNAVPRETWLTRLSCDQRGTVMFDGHSTSQEGAFQFLDIVRQAPYFRDPQFTLKQETRGNQDTVAFTLRCKLQKVED